MRYFAKKNKFRKEDAEKIYIFFRNGDYLEIEKEEIFNVWIRCYDELIWENKEACAVAESGYIKLRIAYTDGRRRKFFLHNKKEYQINRKEYIEKRLVEGQGIDRVVLFDENNWHFTVRGDIIASLTDDGFVYLKFRKNEIYGPVTEEPYYIDLDGVYKSNVEKICLDFENCETFEIFKEEIIDMNLVFKPELEWNSSGYGRVVDKGFIRIKLDPQITYREYNLFDVWRGCGKKIKLSRLITRLCGKKSSNIDICNLYVTYYYAGYCINREERIMLDDVYPKVDYNSYHEEEPCNLIEDELCDEMEEDEDEYEIFESGYAIREPGGTILIKFGELLTKE